MSRDVSGRESQSMDAYVVAGRVMVPRIKYLPKGEPLGELDFTTIEYDTPEEAERELPEVASWECVVPGTAEVRAVPAGTVPVIHKGYWSTRHGPIRKAFRNHALEG